MPIPFLFIAVAVGSAGLGITKSVKAGIDQKDAKKTNARANNTVEKAKVIIEESRKNCSNAIDALGRKKVDILDNSIKNFITEFEKIDHIELSESSGLFELQKMVLDKKTFAELKDLQGIASSLAGGLASGAMAGAVTAFGAYSAAGVLATASTGTAIATLSGAAATNATLAFFGGGSLAAGGLGIAGGTAVLGGLIAGPALAILGFVVGAKASKNKDEAYSNLAKAKDFYEEMITAASVCNQIRRRSAMFYRFLSRLQSIFDPKLYEMSIIIETKGTDFRRYSKEEQECVAATLAIAGAIKSILDTPILDEAGNLTQESGTIMEEQQEKMKELLI